MSDKFKRPFLFSRGERLALTVLCVAIVMLFIVNIMIKQRPLRPSFMESNLDSLLLVYNSALDSLKREDSIDKSKMLSYKKSEGNKDKSRKSNSESKKPKRNKYEKTERNVIDNIEITVIELNNADTTLLKMLPGIGSAFSNRIVEYRQSLGGYVDKSQLLEIYGMDSSRYEGFLKYIAIDTSDVTKLNVNNDGFKTLLAHPYLEFDDVKKICNYREKRGFITSWDMLKRVMNYEPDSLLRYYIEYQ